MPEFGTLKGLSVVLYGGTIAFLVRQLLTFANIEKIGILGTNGTLQYLTPYLLNIVIMYVAIEVWRIANAETSAETIQALSVRHFFLDILILVMVLLATETLNAGASIVPENVATLPSVDRSSIERMFANRLGVGCIILAIIFACVCYRIWLKQGRLTLVTGLDIFAMALSFFGGYLFLVGSPSLTLAWYMTIVGSLLTVGYLFRELTQ